MRPVPRSLCSKCLLLLSLIAWGVPSSHAQGLDFENHEVTYEHVAGSVYMLRGVLSNIAVSIGDDGAVLVDDNFAPLTEDIVAAIRGIRDVPIRFVINTHHHSDHTGGNANLGKLGAIIMSTDNARVRLMDAPFEGGRMPQEGLPVVTFTGPTTIHFNGEQIRAIPVSPSHTDGDAYIYFAGSDVIATGDVFVTIAYPYIRPMDGGTFSGYIGNMQRAIDLAGPETRIVPGHGRVGTREDLIEYRDMLIAIRDRVTGMIADGMSLDEVLAAKPTAEFDPRWGGEPPAVPFTVDEFVTLVYEDLATTD